MGPKIKKWSASTVMSIYNDEDLSVNGFHLVLRMKLNNIGTKHENKGVTYDYI